MSSDTHESPDFQEWEHVTNSQTTGYVLISPALGPSVFHIGSNTTLVDLERGSGSDEANVDLERGSGSDEAKEANVDLERGSGSDEAKDAGEGPSVFHIGSNTTLVDLERGSGSDDAKEVGEDDAINIEDWLNDSSGSKKQGVEDVISEGDIEDRFKESSGPRRQCMEDVISEGDTKDMKAVLDMLFKRGSLKSRVRRARGH